VNIITTENPTPENQQMIIRFLETNPGFKEYVTPRGESLLILSIKYDMPAVFYKLLELKANVNLQDSSGRTALMYAAYNGYINRVNKLLESEADVNIQDSSDRTALMYAEDNLSNNPSSDKIEIYTKIIQSLQRDYKQDDIPERTGQGSNQPTLLENPVAPELTGREFTQGRNFNQGLNDKRAQLNITRNNVLLQPINNRISEQQRELERLRKENAEMELNRANSGTASDDLKKLKEKTKQIASQTEEMEKRTENARKMREEEENSKSEEEKKADAEYEALTKELTKLVIENGHDSDNVKMKEIKNRMNVVQDIREVEQQKRREPLSLTSNSQFKYRFGDVIKEGDVSKNGIQEIGKPVKKRLDYVTEGDRRRGGKSRKRQISRVSKTRKSNGKGSRKQVSRKNTSRKQAARKPERSIKKR